MTRARRVSAEGRRARAVAAGTVQAQPAETRVAAEQVLAAARPVREERAREAAGRRQAAVGPRQAALAPRPEPAAPRLVRACFHIEAPESWAGQVAGDEGASSENGFVWGTSIHGLFDQAGFRRGWLNRARSRKGLPPVSPHESELVTTQLGAELDRWAVHLQQHLNMDLVYAALAVP